MFKYFVFCFLLPIVLLCQNSVNTKQQNMPSQQVLNQNNTLEQANDLEYANSYKTLAEELYVKGKTQEAEVNCNKAIATYQKINAKVELSLANELLLQIKDKNNSKTNINKKKKLTSKAKTENQNYNIEDINSLGIKENTTDSKLDIPVLLKNNLYAPEQSKLLTSKENYKAIETQKEFIKSPEVQKNTDLKISQIQNLATLYSKEKDYSEALKLQQESYNLAITQGKTIEAQKSLEAMAAIYMNMGKTNEALAIYKNFTLNLDKLIAKDSSLVDLKLFKATEAKIQQLENEKQLKDALINKTSLFNKVLLVAAILLILLLGFVAFSFFKIKKQNMAIALQSLRREMNPHFIFNSLNSINQFIAQNNELAANKYLTAYSHLMRTNMENSNKDFIPLNKEIEQLEQYLNLEKMRFPEHFSYQIYVENTLDTNSIEIPNMLIQPHLENAIWHGLRYSKDKGLLELRFKTRNKKLIVEIEDNGIGIEQSKANKTENQKQYQSIGINNVSKRIELLNSLYNKNITCTIQDKPNSTGVIVTLTL